MCGVTVIVACDEATALALADAVEPELRLRGPDVCSRLVLRPVPGVVMVVVAAVLHIQGPAPTQQPLLCCGGDAWLAWNGELYGLAPGVSDTAWLGAHLEAHGTDVVRALEPLDGPYAMLWYRDHTLTLARNDAGQRSLLVALPRPLEGAVLTREADHALGEGPVDVRVAPLVVSSVAVDGVGPWLEVPAGVPYALRNWTHFGPCGQRAQAPPRVLGEAPLATEHVWALLLEATRKRVVTLGAAPVVRLLFSGGVDSALLAVALHLTLPSTTRLALVTVAFGADATDLAQARAALMDLRRMYPERTWEAHEVLCSGQDALATTSQVQRCIAPLTSVMDTTIATVLWHACALPLPGNRVIFSGLGADELFAGYARHVGKWKRGGEAALDAELRLEVARIAYRNGGRDDRVVARWGLEARHPFLDRALVRFALTAPLSALADLGVQGRQGGKMVLRDALQRIGFGPAVWDAPKKAMQACWRGGMPARTCSHAHTLISLARGSTTPFAP